MAAELPVLTVRDAAAWRAWLGEHADEPAGVWLSLAKKGTTNPTTLRYDEALREALCHGWIDGQVRRADERTYQQRFTPRRPRSAWSLRNLGLVEQLAAEGRMTARGLAEVERARRDGRAPAVSLRSLFPGIGPPPERAMAGKSSSPSIKNPKQYEGLKESGMSKQRAAAISNANANNGNASSRKGGKKSHKSS